MNYYNWQKVHKQAFNSWQQKPVTSYTAENLRARAWVNLVRYCNPEELKKLLELAERYNSGKVPL